MGGLFSGRPEAQPEGRQRNLDIKLGRRDSSDGEIDRQSPNIHHQSSVEMLIQFPVVYYKLQFKFKNNHLCCQQRTCDVARTRCPLFPSVRGASRDSHGVWSPAPAEHGSAILRNAAVISAHVLPLGRGPSPRPAVLIPSNGETTPTSPFSAECTAAAE